MHSGLPVQISRKNERIVSYRKEKKTAENLYPGNLWDFLCLKIATWRLSVILVTQPPGRFPNAAVFRSRSFDFDVTRRKSDWMSIKK